jgi:uncharacterized protein (TIGR03435 family)
VKHFRLILICAIAAAQTAPVKPVFDAASVKLAPDQSASGDGWNDDPATGRIRFGKITLHDLIFRAYGLQRDYQLSGPDWLFVPFLSATKLQVIAAFAPHTSQEQLRLMLQNLLAERFNLKVHREAAVRTVYELVVGSKGFKLKESEGRIVNGKPTFYGAVGCNATRFQGNGVTMSPIVASLSSELGTAVADKTGLTGHYDFLVQYDSANAPPSTGDPFSRCSMADALEGFGLKLEKKKGSVDLLVIDHADRQPSEN